MESGVVAKDDNDNAGFGIGIATGDNMTQQKDAMAKGPHREARQTHGPTTFAPPR
jgi:hypothetical protein